jgi:hypothetical protein
MCPTQLEYKTLAFALHLSTLTYLQLPQGTFHKPLLLGATRYV